MWFYRQIEPLGSLHTEWNELNLTFTELPLFIKISLPGKTQKGKKLKSIRDFFKKAFIIVKFSILYLRQQHFLENSSSIDPISHLIIVPLNFLQKLDINIQSNDLFEQYVS